MCCEKPAYGKKREEAKDEKMDLWERLKQAGYREEMLAELSRAEEKLERFPAWKELCACVPAAVGENEEREMEELAREADVPLHTLLFLHILQNLGALARTYREQGIPEARFSDFVADDIRRKVEECLAFEGSIGVFRAAYDFYKGYFDLRKLTIGRLRYEKGVYRGPDVRCGAYALREGDTVQRIHIPGGYPLKKEACLQSLRTAFEQFGCSASRPLRCSCHSWLLNPAHRQMLTRPSNLLDFMDLFIMISAQEQDSFKDAFRLFGPASRDDMSRWPAETRLQRAYLDLLRSGGKAATGFGVLFFDGNRVNPR